MLLLLLLLPLAAASCLDWTPTWQTSRPSLYVHLATGGRLAARLTPYAILLIMRRKHGLEVLVDQKLLDSVTQYFSLPASALLPVAEQTFCPAALQRLLAALQPFTDNRPARLESGLLALRQGQALLLWPEGPPEVSSYWVPDYLLRWAGGG